MTFGSVDSPFFNSLLFRGLMNGVYSKNILGRRILLLLIIFLPLKAEVKNRDDNGSNCKPSRV